MSDPGAGAAVERPWSEVLADLEHASRHVQRVACDVASSRVAREPALLASLQELLRKGTPAGRFAAAFVLFRARKPGLALLPALLDSLSLPDGDRRWEAVHMLVTLGRLEPQVATIVLHEARGAPDPTRRRMCVFVLRELIPTSADARNALLHALDDPDAAVRRAALSSLVKLQPRTSQVLERTLHILRGDRDPKMQLLATAVAVELGSDDAAARREVNAALERARLGSPALERAVDLALRRLKNQE